MTIHVTVREGQLPVVKVGENLAYSLMAREGAEAAKNAACESAAFAEEFSGPAYGTQAAGEAATTDGQFFRVSNGDTPRTYTRYQRTSGGSVVAASLATTAALAAGSVPIGTKRLTPTASLRTSQEAFDDAVSLPQFYDDAIGKAGLGDEDADTAAFNRALTYALANGRALTIPDNPIPFKITSIDFPANETGVDGDTARPTRLLICGTGQIEFVGTGYMFDCSAGYFYDLVVDGPRFVATGGTGAKAFNGDKFIRLIVAPGVQFEKFDHVLHGVEYLQSVKMIGAIIRGGSGAAVKAPMAYDCAFTHNIIEFGNDGIVIDGPGDPAVHTCTIAANVIEGMAGRGVALGTTLATTVEGNYMEANAGGEFFFDEGTAAHKGLRFHSNSMQPTSARIAANAYAVTWGASLALPVRSGGNFCTGHMHDLTDATSMIDTTGDIVAAGKNLTSPNVGREIGTDGLTQYVRWFDRKMTLDPNAMEVGFDGKHNTGGQGPVVTYGTNSPSNDAAQFERTSWARGSIVINATPASGQAWGWICVAAGTPGSWTFIGQLA